MMRYGFAFAGANLLQDLRSSLWATTEGLPLQYPKYQQHE